MATTQYIGARYVPLFADPAEWSSESQYEALTVVLHNGASYTSRQFVPKGVDISNDAFWVLTGNYNAQVEQYRQVVFTYDGRITVADENATKALSTAAAAQATAGKGVLDAAAAQATADKGVLDAATAQAAAEAAQKKADEVGETVTNNIMQIFNALGITDAATATTFKEKVDNAIQKHDVLASYFDTAAGV